MRIAGAYEENDQDALQEVMAVRLLLTHLRAHYDGKTPKEPRGLGIRSRSLSAAPQPPWARPTRRG